MDNPVPRLERDFWYHEIEQVVRTSPSDYRDEALVGEGYVLLFKDMALTLDERMAMSRELSNLARCLQKLIIIC